ncbi:MAG: hypothetical protein Fur0022_18010 [Anaerolineales bacterium]
MDNTALSAREQYLKKLGLKIDPFAYAISELELKHSAYYAGIQYRNGTAKGKDIHTPFLEYFVPPTTTQGTKSLTLEKLREPQHSLIFGQSGSGKTMLRLMLEARMRLVPDIPVRSLVVTHLFRTPDEKVWRALAQSLAIDFVIQLIEQFPVQTTEFGDEHICALNWQLSIGGPQVRRLIERYLKEPEPEGKAGYGILWPQVGRTALKRVVRDPKLAEIFRKILTKEHTQKRELDNSYDLFQKSIRYAKDGGLGQIYLLVDDIDYFSRSEGEMLAILEPLLEKLPVWQEENVYLKGFLPARLEESVTHWLQERKLPKTLVYLNKLKWTAQSLRELIIQRLRTGGSRLISLNDLAGKGLENQLEDNLFLAAQGQPRRLISLMDRLIDTHLRRAPNELFFSLEDWKHSKEQEDSLHDSQQAESR